ncbi:MAG TPA: DedA family protein [Nitrospirae bacterium]|nr:DedA family protein [Nitrospirota bacterium]
MKENSEKSAPAAGWGGRSWTRRLYDWVLHWADTPYGAPALFVLAVVESSFFPIPPDPLILALGISKPKKAIWYATLCTVGSVLGGAIGYMIGYFFIESVGMTIIEIYGLAAKYGMIKELYQQWNAVVVLVAGVSPIPYKVFTIAAGAFKVSFFTFILASIVGRGVRFFAEGLLIYWYGERIRGFMERYTSWIGWAFAIMLVGGFVAVKFLLR